MLNNLITFSIGQLTLIVLCVRTIETILQYVYAYVLNMFTSKSTREKKEPAYKRLSADCSIELHQEVSDMAKKRNVTLKEYILGAIMMRLKLDKDEQ